MTNSDKDKDLNVVTIDLNAIFDTIVSMHEAGRKAPETREEVVEEMGEVWKILYPDLPPPPLALIRLIYAKISMQIITEAIFRASQPMDDSVPPGVTFQ